MLFQFIYNLGALLLLFFVAGLMGFYWLAGIVYIAFGEGRNKFAGVALFLLGCCIFSAVVTIMGWK